MKRGPLPNVKKDKQVLSLRKKGLTFRGIAKKLKLNVRTVHDRYRRAVGYL